MTYHDDITAFVKFTRNAQPEWQGHGTDLYTAAYRAAMVVARRIAVDERLTTCEAWAMEARQQHIVPHDWDDTLRKWGWQDGLSDVLIWFDQWRQRKEAERLVLDTLT